MIKSTNYIGIVLVLGVFLFGCTSNTLDGQGLANKPPTVWLSAAPPEGSQSRYTLTLFWGGWDPDGEIHHYEYAITNNKRGVFDPADTTGAEKWGRVVRNDSTFMFSADVVADSAGLDPDILEPVDFLRSHTFFIRAVDDQGLASAKPAYRSFTSQTLSPVVDVIIPTANGFNAAEVPPISTFEWVGRDYVSNEREVQDPDSVRWILVPTRVFNGSWSAALDYIRKNPYGDPDTATWSAWRYYKASGDSGRFWTTPALDLKNTYMFAVQAKDEAGAVTPVFDEDRNVRRIAVNERNNGPVLQVYNNFIGSITSASPNTPPVILDLPANIPMCFTFKANAAGYGGVASGYRYGWDVQDFNDPTQWEIELTPFVRECENIPCAETPCRAWQFDSHTFYIEVVDNSGYSSRVAVTVNVLPFTMQKPVLVIDDWKENSPGFAATNGGLPSDEEHDEFWEKMLKDVQGFDPRTDVIDVKEEIPLTAFSDYKSVIWVATASFAATTSSFLNQVIRFIDPTAPAGSGKSTPNIIALFTNAGGHVLVVGDEVMTGSINRDSFNPTAPVFPMIFRYELTGDQDGDYEDSNVGVRGMGEDSFPYSECCLNVLDIAYITNRLSVRRSGTHGCPVSGIRRAPQSGRNDGLRVALPLDDKYEFPTLHLRPDVGGPGAWFDETRLGLNSDVYNPPYFAAIPMVVVANATCNNVAELVPPRDCFKPIYGNGCYNDGSSEERPMSKIYNAPVAFWTTVHEDRIPDAGGFGARSAVWGFHPVYFVELEVKAALNIVLFDEWQLPRVP